MVDHYVENLTSPPVTLCRDDTYSAMARLRRPSGRRAFSATLIFAHQLRGRQQRRHSRKWQRRTPSYPDVRHLHALITPMLHLLHGGSLLTGGTPVLLQAPPSLTGRAGIPGGTRAAGQPRGQQPGYPMRGWRFSCASPLSSPASPWASESAVSCGVACLIPHMVLSKHASAGTGMLGYITIVRGRMKVLREANNELPHVGYAGSTQSWLTSPGGAMGC